MYLKIFLNDSEIESYNDLSIIDILNKSEELKKDYDIKSRIEWDFEKNDFKGWKFYLTEKKKKARKKKSKQ